MSHKSFIHGAAYRRLEAAMLWQMAGMAWKAYADKRQAWRALRAQVRTHLRYKNITHLYKAVRVGERTLLQLSFPPLNTPAMEVLVNNELHRNVPIPGREQGLNTLILAITKKCALQCAHCFEWDSLNGKESLDADAIIEIIRRFQSNGIASIELSGGEPLNRYKDLLRILQESDTAASDFWLLSSGYRLDAEKARALRQAGLQGICISLDHWDAAQHDAFRGMEGSFDWALRAAHNAREAGLAVCFSLTAVREMCNLPDLMRYAELAREHGAHFIRLLEPRAVGHFDGLPVELNPAEWSVLEEFTRILQTDDQYLDYPIVDYYAAYQRREGCSGAAKRFLYVDTDGDMHACPFCRNKCGNVLQDGIAKGRKQLELASGCHAFETV